jgi:hypothetical protein
MDETNELWSEFTVLVAEFGNTLGSSVPKIIGAAILLALGWYISRLAGTWTGKFLRSFNEMLTRHWRSGVGGNTRLSQSAISASSSIIKWLLFFIILAGISNLLGVESLAKLFEQVVSWLPSFIAGCAIVFVGVVASQFVNDFVTALTRTSTEGGATIFGRLSQILVVVTALVMGVGQAGIDTTLLVSIITILLAGLFGGMAIAFGLGARDLASNLIGAHQVSKSYMIGQNIKLGDLRGVLTRVTSTEAVLETSSGVVSVPGGEFLRAPVFILDDQDDSDG